PPLQVPPTMPATTEGGDLAPGVDPVGLGTVGGADGRIQPYTFRLCVTTDPENRVAFPRPQGYDAGGYQLVGRHLQALAGSQKGVVLGNVVTISDIPEGKADLNAAGPLSTDLLGGSDTYPTATYAERDQIWQDHYRYEAGLLYYLTNDMSVPEPVRGPL